MRTVCCHFTVQHSCKGVATNKKTRVWKNLRQIVAAERLLPWKPDDVTCAYIIIIAQHSNAHVTIDVINKTKGRMS